jgi:hypothetical protein
LPTINLTDDELATVTAAIRGVIEDDRFPHAPRLDPLRAALGTFDAAREQTHPKGPAGSPSRQARAAITGPNRSISPALV